MAKLKQLKPHSHLIPGVNLYFNDQEQGESDIIGTYDGRLLAGEVKTSPGDFTEKQVDHDTRISISLGADIHLMASIYSIDKEARAYAQAACRAHRMELMVLDNLQAQEPDSH
ncbi:hypothetical protein [Streptomyces qinglanensis]|uniref:hypothetical protein n=1 Tax=Streptomyces qinglanensis TaxID=943816 RepID=UPI0037BE18CE